MLGLRTIKKYNVNIKIIDIRVNNKINKKNNEWTKEKVIDIIDYIKIRFIVIRLVRYNL